VAVSFPPSGLTVILYTPESLLQKTVLFSLIESASGAG
jgi:hypothetical protein